MAEPSIHGFGAPARRSVGRLGPVVLLVLGVLALAVMTHAQALDRAGPADPADASDSSDAAGPADAPAAFAFGSTTAEGAIVFRLGRSVHAWAVDAGGAPRWQRDLDPGDAVACGPCPEAVVSHADGSAARVAPDGSVGPPPGAVAGGLIPTRSLTGVVLSVARGPGAVEFLVPTSDGLVGAGTLDDARLDQPLIVVTPAARGRAVTVLRASSDPLRQAEFEVVHVTPLGSSTRTVDLDEPGARPFPCAVADGTTVAYLQQLTGPTASGSTHLVVRADEGAGVEATVAGTFDSCAAGPDGAVLVSAVTGADGDPTRTVVEIVWLGPSLEVRATTSEPIASARASVAIDPPSLRVAVAGGPGPLVVLDGGTRVERAPAAAVAFDDRGGLWAVDADARVTHEVGP
ncbi:MAG: hypothetical protein ACXWB2_15335 [Acidimicrobiales bacterium]